MDEYTEGRIRDFWQTHPCGDAQVGGLRDDYETFFQAYDAFRYRQEGHIPRRLDAIDFRGRKVLEIGLGQGADSEQIIRRGGDWSGIDLTRESVDRVRTRLALRDLPHDRLEQGSALEMPFPDGYFDIVFSHGVLHHIPEIDKAQQEIARVLKSGGRLIIRVYSRFSLNYLVSIAVFRRLGLTALYLLSRLGYRPRGIYREHIAIANREGLGSYLRMRRFLHRNTDGPQNPYSKVYSLAEVRRDFPLFRVERAVKEFRHAPPLPVSRLPGERLWGWHLWVEMTAE